MGPDEDSSLMNSSFVWSVRPVRFSACAVRAAAISSRRERADCTGTAAAGAETPAFRGCTPNAPPEGGGAPKLPKTRAARAATALVCVEET